MLSNGTDSRVVEDQKAQQNKFAKLLKDSIKDFSEWPVGRQVLAVAVFTGFIAALPTIAPAMIASVVAGGVVAHVGLAVLGGLALLFAAKATPYVIKGLKWSAEKTVDGAKYTAGKVKDASVYTAEKAREGYYSVKGAISSVGRATREGTGATLGKMGRSLSNLSESMSSLDAIPYSIGNEGQTVVLKTEEKTRNFDSVKEIFIKKVLEDKAVNSSALTKEIFSKLGEKILEKAYSFDGQSGFQKDQFINRLKQQVDFVNKLDAKKLQNLLSKDNNSLYEIFSDHHDEIKRIVKECKIEHKFSNSVENLNKVAGKYGIRKGATQSIENSLSRSSSLDSVRTDSTVSNEPLKEATDIKYQAFSKPDTSSRQVGERAFYVAPPKLPRSNSLDEGTLTHSNSTDSGMGSGSSTLTRKQVLPLKEGFDRELEEKLAKRRASLDQPSAEPVNSRATATPGTV